MIVPTTAKCPYCGHSQNEVVDTNDGIVGHKIVLCDVEDGGCDEYYAMFYAVNVAVETRAISKEATKWG